MKTLVSALMVGMMVLATGCATGKWVKAGQQPGDWDSDIKSCQYEVELGAGQTQSAGRYRGVGANLGAGFAAGLNDAFRRNKLMGLCMEAKGWRKELDRVPVTTASTQVQIETRVESGGK